MGNRGIRKTISGVVISNKMDKTVVVLTERLVKHPRFHKYIRRRSKYSANDEGNQCDIGDKVLIVESRPLSKRKRWKMCEILEKAK